MTTPRGGPADSTPVGDRSPVNGLPFWAKMVLAVGVVPAITFFLLGVLTGLVPSPITETAAMMRRHEANGETQTRLLRAICRQGAKTDFSAAECER